VGSGGLKLFDDDTAADVRDSYRDALAQGLTDQEAEASTLQEFEDALADDDESVNVWLALAATQFKLGRLSDFVRDRALRVIEQGADLAKWREVGPGAEGKRADELRRLGEQLRGTQPSRKRVPRARAVVSTLRPGQVLGYRADSGRLHLMWVTDLIQEPGRLAPIVRLLDYAEDETPAESVLDSIKPRAADRYRWPDVEFLILEEVRKAPADYGLTVLGTRPVESQRTESPANILTWPAMLHHLDARDAAQDGMT
jgi:hypothetical protein